MGASFEISGFDQIQKRLREMGRKGARIEGQALKAGGAIVQEKLREIAPRSNSPRQPTEGTQSWRTGKHAADHFQVSRVKRVQNVKVVEIGISKADNSHYFYLKFHEYGTEKLQPKPFMNRSIQLSRQQIMAAMSQIYKRGLGL